MNDRPNPPANFDPSCTLLVETNPDPDKGVSVALTVAVCDGYAPGPSWLVTKENGDQSMVVLMVRPSRAGTISEADALAVWHGSKVRALGFVLALVAIAGWCVVLAGALR